MQKLIALLTLFLLSQHGLATDLPVVKQVSLQRYAGRWHEIARLPNRFQEICAENVSADYTLRNDGKIDVLNQCRKQDGTMTSALGLARLAEGPDHPGKLEVRFAPSWLGFLPFVWGDYWILDLADDYSTSLVGTPDRQFLWLLARTPELPLQRRTALLDKARQLGFATDKVILTRQQP